MTYFRLKFYYRSGSGLLSAIPPPLSRRISTFLLPRCRLPLFSVPRVSYLFFKYWIWNFGWMILRWKKLNSKLLQLERIVIKVYFWMIFNVNLSNAGGSDRGGSKLFLYLIIPWSFCFFWMQFLNKLVQFLSLSQKSAVETYLISLEWKSEKEKF